ncbi:MAG: hypothetical protein ACE5FK_06290, partial [Candidatus Methylomirabilia bacterium]
MIARRRRRLRPRGRARSVASSVIGLSLLAATFVGGTLVGQEWTRSRSQPAGAGQRSARFASKGLEARALDRSARIQDKLTFYRTL